MVVNVTPELEAKLDRLATSSGRSRDDLVAEALASFVEECDEVSAELEQRYDQVLSGQVELIEGEEAFARLRRHIAER